MNIQMMNPHDLIAYENNPRHNDDAVDAVANFIKVFGCRLSLPRIGLLLRVIPD